MSKTKSDRKLNRFSTIIEIITNLGTIGSWILGAGSAYLLNIQNFPIVVPGINFTLDVYFQFSLLICSMLAYIHFLQNYWNKNKEKLLLSNSFMDFSFWELPRLKHPLLLIPIVIIALVSVQLLFTSFVLVIFFLLILSICIYFTVERFQYNLSPNRKYERWMRTWKNDAEWMEKWFRRIRAKLDVYGNVAVRDLYEVGLSRDDYGDKIEIEFALQGYFNKFEFEEDLVLIQTDRLPSKHPEFSIFPQWILLRRENLSLRRNEDT